MSVSRLCYISSLCLCLSGERLHLSIHAPSVKLSCTLTGSLKDVNSLQKKNVLGSFGHQQWLKTTYSKAGKWNVQCTRSYATHISAFVLPSAHCSQTNPSSFMSLWGLLLLLLIRGGKLSSASAQPISTVSMNIWTGPSTRLCVPWERPVESRTCSHDKWYVCFTKEGGSEGDNRYLTRGELGTGIFIGAHSVDGYLLYVGKLVSFECCCMTLIDRQFWEGSTRNGKIVILRA